MKAGDTQWYSWGDDMAAGCDRSIRNGMVIIRCGIDTYQIFRAWICETSSASYSGRYHPHLQHWFNVWEGWVR
jgi:hypothetical protein